MAPGRLAGDLGRSGRVQAHDGAEQHGLGLVPRQRGDEAGVRFHGNGLDGAVRGVLGPRL